MYRPFARGEQNPTAVTIPNFITIGRLVLVPLIIWLIIAHEPLTAFVCFVIAGISDGVDGFIARQFNKRSALGAYLDPLADKALLVSIYIAFALTGEIPAWLAILIVSRDVLIIGGVMLAWILGQPIDVRPLIVSKVNTVAQIVLAATVLGDLAFPLDLAYPRLVLVAVVAVLTIASAGVYVVDWMRHMAGTSEARPGDPGGSEGRGETP